MADLLVRVSHGDPAAWAEVLRRYGKVVSTTVRSFRLQDADALDAVQMTWLQLAENAHRVQFPERLSGWLADADTTRTLRKFVDELPPRRRTLLRALFTDNPCPYAEAARAVGIPLSGIGPTRARALRQLRDKLNEHGHGPGAC